MELPTHPVPVWLCLPVSGALGAALEDDLLLGRGRDPLGMRGS